MLTVQEFRGFYLNIEEGYRYWSFSGGYFIINKIRSSIDIEITFCDLQAVTKRTTADKIRKGLVTNPYFPTVCGVGYTGEGTFSSTTLDNRITKPYRAWAEMLNRVYNTQHKSAKYYENVTVHTDWWNFQVFAKWYTDMLGYFPPNTVLCLDKDLRGNGLLYSESTCSLIPKALNSLIKAPSKRGILPGVIRSSKTFYCSLDRPKIRYKTELEAHLQYRKLKTENLMFIIPSFKDKIHPEAYTALLNKNFEYLFDYSANK